MPRLRARLLWLGVQQQNSSRRGRRASDSFLAPPVVVSLPPHSSDGPCPVPMPGFAEFRTSEEDERRAGATSAAACGEERPFRSEVGRVSRRWRWRRGDGEATARRRLVLLVWRRGTDRGR